MLGERDLVRIAGRFPAAAHEAMHQLEGAELVGADDELLTLALPEAPRRLSDVLSRLSAAGAEILRHCIDLGGSLTGEHGVGVEKREWMPLLFGEADLAVMRRLRDAADPDGLCNPGKLLPTGGSCVELSTARRQVAL